MDETVSYAYDAGGLRTQMTLPGSKTIAYSYDATGRLIGLTAWDDQHSDFHYDKVGRHVGTQRPNGLSSGYAYDPASRLRRVRHRAGSSLRGQFNYTVDGRGNRTRAFERLAQSTTVTATYNKSASQVTFPTGTWTDAGDFKQTAQFSGRMQIAYTGDEALLTVGVGPDHGIIDISINGRYWRRFDAYATTPAERVIHLPEVTTPPGATSGVIEIRNRSDRHHRSTGHVFRFKQLTVIDTTYNERTIDYTYDGLSRLLTANYDGGAVEYTYGYDLAGNLTNNNGKTRTYNATNQLTNDGTNVLTYDANGNLTSNGTNTYTWDRANRMLTAPNNTSYAYDGLGNRISQSIGTTNPTVTQYLLDTQPGLTKVLAATTGINTDHYIHAPQGSNVPGIHAMQSNTGDWSYMAQDGLGSVRSLINSTLNVSSVQNYAPYGEPFGTVGNFNTPFAFTGEQTDANDMLFLRARYYNPSLGVFPSLDPFEGTMARPMSLNGYSWVEGNPVSRRDPRGLQAVDWNHALQNPPSLLNAAFDFPNFTSYLADLVHNAGLINRETANPEDLALILLIEQLNTYRCQLQNSGRSEEYLNWELWLRLFANGIDISDRRNSYDPFNYLQNVQCSQNVFGGTFGCLDPVLVGSAAFQSTLGRQLLQQCLPLRAQNPGIVGATGGTLDRLLRDRCSQPISPPADTPSGIPWEIYSWWMDNMVYSQWSQDVRADPVRRGSEAVFTGWSIVVSFGNPASLAGATPKVIQLLNAARLGVWTYVGGTVTHNLINDEGNILEGVSPITVGQSAISAAILAGLNAYFIPQLEIAGNPNTNIAMFAGLVGSLYATVEYATTEDDLSTAGVLFESLSGLSNAIAAYDSKIGTTLELIIDFVKETVSAGID